MSSHRLVGQSGSTSQERRRQTLHWRSKRRWRAISVHLGSLNKMPSAISLAVFRIWCKGSQILLTKCPFITILTISPQECWFTSNSLGRKRTKIKASTIRAVASFSAGSQQPARTNTAGDGQGSAALLTMLVKFFTSESFYVNALEASSYFNTGEKTALSPNCWEWIWWVDKHCYKSASWKNFENFFPKAKNNESDRRKAL